MYSNNFRLQSSPSHDWDKINAYTKVKNTLSELFKSQLNTDCSFEVGSGRHKMVIGAHKKALVTYSSVLEAMLCGPFSHLNGDQTIRVADIEPATFACLLECIYGEDGFSINSFEQLCNLYCAAHKYMMPSFLHWFSFGFREVIDVSNACEAYEFGKFFDDEFIVRESVMTMKKKTQDVLAHPSFLEAAYETLLHIFDLEPLFIASETVLHDAVLKWMRHYCKRMRVDFSNRDVRKMLGAAFAKIDFASMTAAERSSISESPFLANDDGTERNVLSDSEMPVNASHCRTSRRIHVPLDMLRESKHFVAVPSPSLEEKGVIEIHKGTSYTIKFVSNCDVTVRGLNILHGKRSSKYPSSAEYIKILANFGGYLTEESMSYTFDGERSGFIPFTGNCDIIKDQVNTITIEYEAKINYPRVGSPSEGCEAFFKETNCKSVVFRVDWTPESFCFVDSITFSITDKGHEVEGALDS